MIRDRAFWVFIAIMISVAAVCVELAVRYRDQIEFAPATAINDGLDFILGLLAMIISFWIAEIYWKNKVEREQTARTVDQLHYYLSHVATIVVETSEALARIDRAADESVRLEQEVLANLRRLGDGNRNTLRIMDVSGLELRRDRRAARASAYFRSAVAPVLDKLARRPYVRPDVEEIKSVLASVGEDIENTVRWLKGEFDASNPPWGSNRERSPSRHGQTILDRR